MESVKLPSTLKRLEAETFCSCGNLKNANLPNGVEHIEKRCFSNSGIKRIIIPSTLKEIAEDALSGCGNLSTALVKKGCALDVKKYLTDSVEVRQI